jgi:hypothetical protein
MGNDIFKEAVASFVVGLAMLWGASNYLQGAPAISHKVIFLGGAAVVLSPLILSLNALLEGFKYEDSSRLVLSGVSGVVCVAALAGVFVYVPNYW